MRSEDNLGQPGAGEDDLTLVERALCGDRGAFELLVRRHERRVYRVSLAVLGNAEDAEEAMQDAFIRAYRHLGQFRRESKFTTWLTRITVNEAIEKRKRRHEAVPFDDVRASAEFVPRRAESWHADPEKLYGKQELRGMVESAIRALPEIYREAFVLRDVEGMSAEEAAQSIGITVAALKSRLLRARLIVREALAASLEQPPTLSRRILHTAEGMGISMAMRLMRNVRKQV
jgi:RNA polymerase sigma-70 factor, ECF subfamily